jgi:hypothetical protein
MDPHAALRKYFTIRQAGAPSSTVQLDYALSTHLYPGEPPGWLVKHCEVGDAIERLEPCERDAVIIRWTARTTIDECERAIRIAASKELDCKRAGFSDAARRWGGLAQDAEKEAQKNERVMAKWERRKAYKRGMERLVMALAERIAV